MDCTAIECDDPTRTARTWAVTVVRRDLKTKENLDGGRVKNTPETG